MAKTFYIMRHGATFATRSRFGYGWRIFSAPILEDGKPTLHKMGQYLKDLPIDFAICSPIKRCRQTAAIITEETGLEFTTDKRLTEYFLQTFGQFHRRVKSIFEELEASPHQHILIITHAAVIAGLTEFLLKGNFSVKQIFTYPEPGILEIISNHHLQQIDFN